MQAPRTIVRNWATVANGATSANQSSRYAGAFVANATWSTDNPPSANVAMTNGCDSRAPARRTTSWARPADSPACHVNQWANDRTPDPAHAPDAIASAANSTSSAWSALSCPHTTRNRSSIDRSTLEIHPHTIHMFDQACNTCSRGLEVTGPLPTG